MKKVPTDVIQLLIDALEERRVVGLQTYGRTLQPFDGRDNLQDILEETLDRAAYLRKEILERETFKALQRWECFECRCEIFINPEWVEGGLNCPRCPTGTMVCPSKTDRRPSAT